MIVGCSPKYTKEDAQQKCESILNRMNDYGIGKFTLLSTNQKNREATNFYQSSSYYNCVIKYTTLNDNDIDVTFTIDNAGLYSIKLEDDEIYTYSNSFQEYYSFYESIINDYEYYSIDNLDSEKNEVFKDFLNDELNSNNSFNECFIENGNMTVRFSYSKITETKDDIKMHLTIEQ